jgi:amino acid adenylation domain-containing protein
VRRTQALLAELLHHEHASLALAQRCSGLPPQVPLFSTLLNYRHHALSEDGLAADHPLAAVEWLWDEERTNYPLTLAVEDYGQALGLTVKVTRPLSAQRVCASVERVLESLVAALEQDPAQAVGRLEVLPEAERHQLLVEWNATQAEYAQDACVHQLVEAQVRRDPQAQAVVYEERCLSYGELNAQANRLAHHLRSLGVGPDVPVAICVERSLEMVVGLLAIMKAGGAYVPLDPAYPPERLAFMLGDSSPIAVLSHAPARVALAGVLAEFTQAPPRVLDLIEDAGRWAHEPPSDPDPAAVGLASRHLAYIIYTSGSTGVPKGVMVEHRNVLHFVHGLEACIHSLQPDCRRIAWNSSFGFDMAVKAWSQLLMGRSVYLLPETVRLSAELLLEFLEQHRIEAIECTPSHLRMMQDGGLLRGRAGSLRKVLLGGEPIDAVTWKRLAAEPIYFFNMYGPTECSVDASCGRIEGETVHVGRVMPNARIYVLDGRQRPVSIGVSGEICIGGAGVARGYLNQPKLTTEQFLPDPFISGSDARIYRTGDLGRWRPDGTIEYLGRNDRQVKIRGFRIELGEIEARLLEHPGVCEAIVLAREDATGGKRLVAYVTGAIGDDADSVAAALRQRLARTLPEHMMPAAYVRLDTLPLTPNGKLDRAALPAPDGAAYVSRVYESPQGAVETTLAGIWSELLGVERVGRHDNFFELGGHSLLAVRLIMRVHQRVKKTVALGSIFQHPVLKDLSCHIAGEDDRAASSNLVKIRSSAAAAPVFFVPTGMGDFAYAFALAEDIDASHSIYVLKWPDPADHILTIQGMAAKLVSEIRKIQPFGPYRLAGYSSGGVVAYAIAQYLIGIDEEVSSLLFIDVKHRPNRPEINIVDRFIDSLIYDARPADLDKIKKLRENRYDTGLIDLITQAKRLGLLTEEENPELECVSWEASQRYQSKLRDYRPMTLPLVLRQFYAAEQIASPERMAKALITEPPDDEVLRSPTGGWEQVLPLSSIRLEAVPGDHSTMTTEPANRAMLGAKLSAALGESFPLPSHANDSYVPLFPLNTARGTEAPLFLVPGAGANISSFVHLAGILGERRPLYGLQPRGLQSGEVPHTAVEAAAEAYIKSITALNHDGPIHLLGHSFGGAVAFEMAHRLKARGHLVASLTLVDSEPPDAEGVIVKDIRQSQVHRDLVDTIRWSFECALEIDEAVLSSGNVDMFVTHLHAGMVRHRLLPGRTRSDVLYGPLETFAAAQRTVYIPTQAYAGVVNLILVRDPKLDTHGNQAQYEIFADGWRRWAPELEIWRGPGDHFSILRAPHVAALADRWREIARRASEDNDL